VEVVSAPIVREDDGLAMSSRNANLDREARVQARVLVRALDAAQKALAAGERDAQALLGLVRAEIGKAPRAEIDYAELRCPESLASAPDRLEGAALLALAVFLRPAAGCEGAGVRLIDNRVLRP
jgi:pantoate--beta-alanine ligase